MANAATKAAANSGEKKARKTPVRKGPQAKDYPSRVAYLEAVLQYERDEQAKADQAKADRLDKRIEKKREVVATAQAELDKLIAEREALVGSQPTEAEAETPES